MIGYELALLVRPKAMLHAISGLASGCKVQKSERLQYLLIALDIAKPFELIRA